VLNEIEQAALAAHFEGREESGSLTDDSESLALYLGLRFMLQSGKVIRENRTGIDRADVTLKEDGSPATAIEELIEQRLRQIIPAFDFEPVVVGEETGGELPAAGSALVIDPIDGTWAFLTETETYSTTLALIRDGRAILGMVGNPVSGEIVYATAEGGARLLRLPVFGEPVAAHPLPTQEAPDRPVLVNFHPSRSGRAVSDCLLEAWERGEISMLRSPGGSPAWALVEAARGHFTYLNLWAKRPARPYDLAAGALILRRAGGEVTDLAGRPVDALGHSGPFVAGLDPEVAVRLGQLVLKAKGTNASDQVGGGPRSG
jgi:fructose-1,6-bisphosphatase/inositol monophosphatase family enzyme